TIWLTGEHRLDRLPDLLLFRREPDLVARAADPGAIECNLARLNELSQCRREDWDRQRWLISGLAQLLEPNARLFRVLLMERIEQLADALSETLPAVGQHRGSAASVRKSDEFQLRCNGSRRRFTHCPIAEERIEINPASGRSQDGPKGRHWVLLSEAEESGAPFRRSTAPLGCAEIDENAAANGSA